MSRRRTSWRIFKAQSTSMARIVKLACMNILESKPPGGGVQQCDLRQRSGKHDLKRPLALR